jgi:hypothetical protein
MLQPYAYHVEHLPSPIVSVSLQGWLGIWHGHPRIPQPLNQENPRQEQYHSHGIDPHEADLLPVKATLNTSPDGESKALSDRAGHVEIFLLFSRNWLAEPDVVVTRCSVLKIAEHCAAIHLTIYPACYPVNASMESACECNVCTVVVGARLYPVSHLFPALVRGKHF